MTAAKLHPGEPDLSKMSLEQKLQFARTNQARYAKIAETPGLSLAAAMAAQSMARSYGAAATLYEKAQAHQAANQDLPEVVSPTLAPTHALLTTPALRRLASWYRQFPNPESQRVAQNLEGLAKAFDAIDREKRRLYEAAVKAREESKRAGLRPSGSDDDCRILESIRQAELTRRYNFEKRTSGLR